MKVSLHNLSGLLHSMKVAFTRYLLASVAELVVMLKVPAFPVLPVSKYTG